jgi:hypothetical protein
MKLISTARYHGLRNTNTNHLGLTPQALCSRLLRRLRNNVGVSAPGFRTAVLICCCLFFSAPTHASVRSIWAVNDGEKIERDDLNNPNKSNNSAWDGHKIKIFGARNEIIAFQIIVEADKEGINGLTVTLKELARKDGKGTIKYTAPTLDPTNYVGRPIQLFSINYMNVEMASRAQWVYQQDSPAAPKDPTGWKPVQLVPENARSGLGGFPLKVSADANQGIWIEIYTDRSLPPGLYNGSVTVTADGKKQMVPIELELFDFTLADENSMQAMVYYESLQPTLYHGRDLDAEYHRFAHRQRIELVQSYNIAGVEAQRGRFDGKDFSRARGYEGPGQNVGNQIIPRTFYGPGETFDDRATAWREADNWITFLHSNLPRALTFLYLPDEPGPSQYNYIRQLAENIHSNPGPGKSLPTFITKHYVKELDGAIDIWDTGPLGYDIKRAEQERAWAQVLDLQRRPSGCRRDCDRLTATDARPLSGPVSNMASTTTSFGMACIGNTIGRRWREKAERLGQSNYF